MNMRYGVWILVMVAGVGCVEIGQLLAPRPGEPPAPNFNDNLPSNANENASTNGNVNDNASSNGNTNENENLNANDNADTNGNQNGNENGNQNGNANENGNDNSNDEAEAIFGGIGEIPPLEGDVVTTDSGLQYIDISVGGGELAMTDSIVTVNYTGWLTDGTEFDSAQTAQFALTAVIRGWAEGIGGPILPGASPMRVGGRRRLLIPPDLAYGEGGSPPSIPPNATLIFDIDLLEIDN